MREWSTANALMGILSLASGLKSEDVKSAVAKLCESRYYMWDEMEHYRRLERSKLKDTDENALRSHIDSALPFLSLDVQGVIVAYLPVESDIL